MLLKFVKLINLWTNFGRRIHPNIYGSYLIKYVETIVAKKIGKKKTKSWQKIEFLTKPLQLIILISIESRHFAKKNIIFDQISRYFNVQLCL